MNNHCSTLTGTRRCGARNQLELNNARWAAAFLGLAFCLLLSGYTSPAQTPAGRVVAWNGLGRSWPDVRPGSTIFTNIDCGRLGITSDGRVLPWPDATDPVPPNLSNVVATAGYSLALKADGTVVAWGNWTNYTPNLSGVKAIAAGSGRAMALLSNGTPEQWHGHGLGI